MKRTVGRSAQALLVVVTLGGLALRGAARPSPVPAPLPTSSGWVATFPVPWTPEGLRSVGAYTGGAVVVNFESLSPLLIEPSASGVWEVLTAEPYAGHVNFRETTPGLVPNPDPDAEFAYKRAEGAITAMAWVDRAFQDTRVSVRVNTTGGPGGAGSSSRQGPLLRWDKGSNWLWCALNFAAGTVSIVRGQHFGIIKDLDGSVSPVQGFDNRKAYDLTFSASGQQLSCQVRDQGQLVAQSTATDPLPPASGVAGVLFEVALEKPFDPLQGSFNQLAASALLSTP